MSSLAASVMTMIWRVLPVPSAPVSWYEVTEARCTMIGRLKCYVGLSGKKGMARQCSLTDGSSPTSGCAVGSFLFSSANNDAETTKAVVSRLSTSLLCFCKRSVTNRAKSGLMPGLLTLEPSSESFCGLISWSVHALSRSLSSAWSSSTPSA